MDPEQPKAALTESHKEAPGEKLLQADVRKSEHVNKLRSQMATRQPSTRNVGGTVVISDHVGTPTKRESMTIEADEIGEGGQSIVSYRFVDCKFFDIILNKEKVGQLDFGKSILSCPCFDFPWCNGAAGSSSGYILPTPVCHTRLLL